MSHKASLRNQLEQLFGKYPDIPREVIVKEDMLRLGQAFTEAALQAGEGYRTKQYGGYVFSFDLATHEQLRLGERSRVPEFLELKGGPYGLRGRLRVRCRINPMSPYIVDVIDGSLMVCECEDNQVVPIAEVKPPKVEAEKLGSLRN